MLNLTVSPVAKAYAVISAIVVIVQGWFEITRAKYAMGPIGSAQYRSDTQASTTISTFSMTGVRGTPDSSTSLGQVFFDCFWGSLAWIYFQRHPD